MTHSLTHSPESKSQSQNQNQTFQQLILKNSTTQYSQRQRQRQRHRKSKVITSLNPVNSDLEKSEKRRSIRGEGFGRRERVMNLRWRRKDLSMIVNIVDVWWRKSSNRFGRGGFRGWWRRHENSVRSNFADDRRRRRRFGVGRHCRRMTNLEQVWSENEKNKNRSWRCGCLFLWSVLS